MNLCGHSPTGEPDAGNLHVRFGGRGGANQCAIPTPMCDDKPMKPNSESPVPVAARYDCVAEGNCVSARMRGEQSEVKDQPQTKVNPIRPGIVTSQRGQHICGKPGVCGEVRGASPILSPDIPRYPGTEERCRVPGVGMVRRLHGLSHESRLATGSPAAVRALIVATKRVTTVERRGAGR